MVVRINLSTNLNNPTQNYLNLPVIIRSPRKILPTKAIIDTGSPTTIIGSTEAKLLQIPYKGSQKLETIKIGGGKHKAMSFDKLMITLRPIEGNPVREKLFVKVLDYNERVPTFFNLLLGMDFLKRTGYRLFCDMKNDVAYLEKD